MLAEAWGDVMLRLASRGAKVVVNDLGGAVDGTGSLSAEKASRKLNLQVKAIANGASVTDLAQVEEMVKQTMDTWAG